MQCVFEIGSNSDSLNDELNFLKFIAVKRDFNQSVIDKVVNKFNRPSS